MSNFLRRVIALCAFLLLSSMSWSATSEKLTILSSIRPLTLLASDLVAGLPVEIKTLLPTNADPHNWAMRVSDRQALASADLVIWLGPDFESFLVKPLQQLAPDAQLQLDVLPGLQWPQSHDGDHHGHHDHHHHSGRDMHLWLNPANAVEIQKVLADKLGTQMPASREELQLRLQRQITLIEQMQADVHRNLAPHRQHGFIAYHDAYGHFVDAFGLRQLDAVNQSSEQRLSARQLLQLQDQAQKAQCLMAEKAGEQEQRLAKMLELPLVVADGLALNPEIQTYTAFLAEIAAAFKLCTSPAAD